MSEDVSRHALNQIANAPVRELPFPHVHARDIRKRRVRRALLLYDIKVENPPEIARSAAAHSTPLPGIPS
jgi:hypothetical protein